MDYKRFTGIITEELKSFFPDTYSIELSSISKNNGKTKDAFVIKDSGEKVAPTIYVDSFYREHER